MLKTPVSRLVPQMALPSIAAMLVTSAYHLADTFFVSKLGTYATGAVGVNSSIDHLILMAGSFLAVGSSSYTSRLLGANKDEQAARVLSTSFFFALFTGFLVFLLGNIFQVPLLRALGSSDAILPYSRQYARYVLLAAPFMAANFVLNHCLRAEGNSFYSMVGMVFGAVLNCVLDPIFIFSFRWGVAGASLATAISKIVSFCILLAPYLRRRTLLRISPKLVRFVYGDVSEVIKTGSPSLFRLALSTIAAIILNNLAVSYGESALAAITVANRVTMFLVSACLGFGQGFQPVAGFSWGAGRYDRVEEAYRFSAWAAIIGIAIPSLLIAVFARPVMYLFTTEDLEMVNIGMFSLVIQCLAMPLHAWAIIINMLCVGIGRAKSALILSLSRQGICFYPILPVMLWLWGVKGLAAVQGMADMLTILLGLPIIGLIKRDLRQQMENVRVASKNNSVT